MLCRNPPPGLEAQTTGMPPPFWRGGGSPSHPCIWHPPMVVHGHNLSIMPQYPLLGFYLLCIFPLDLFDHACSSQPPPDVVGKVCDTQSLFWIMIPSAVLTGWLLVMSLATESTNVKKPCCSFKGISKDCLSLGLQSVP